MMQKLLILIGMLSFMAMLSCSPTKKKTYVIVCFDVEDYTTPVSKGIDDIPKWLAEIMSEEGVTGTFFVIGEKARSLQKRGRQDVIAAMAKHDIGSHTNFGSMHPTVTEILEHASWDDGVSKMLEQEAAGFAQLTSIFNMPMVTLARHGGSYGPQLVHALGKMGAGYVYSPIHLPGHNVVWFCNTLNFHGEYGDFDDSYYRDDLFEPILDSLKARFPRAIEAVDVLSFFACHPCKVRTEQFWDFNYYYGANPDSSDWKTPELRPLASMATAKKNFRRLMQFLKNRDDIEITTFRSLMQTYSNQKEFITRKELTTIATEIIKENTIIIDDYFSPAEVFTGLVQAIIEFHQGGALLKKVKRTSPLGPMMMPIAEPELARVTLEQVYELAQQAVEHIDGDGSLPACLNVNDCRIGTGSLLLLFSVVYLDLNSKKPAAEYPVQAFAAYPQVNETAIIAGVNDCKSWPVHRLDLDLTHLIELTRMQLWTLKPAFP